MWINASERKPDNSRVVLVRGKIEINNFRPREFIFVACWHDFDNQWAHITMLESLDTAKTPENITHWMEISDLLTLPIEGETKEESKINVPIEDWHIKHRMAPMRLSEWERMVVLAAHGPQFYLDDQDNWRLYDRGYADENLRCWFLTDDGKEYFSYYTKGRK
jgi:hypothetical protein